jgi:ArsR family transcriptional regulator, arsenate/arsenite/antimonite-responsive transcriptional repressor
MSKTASKAPPRVDRLFRAMSDPIRLRMLFVLRQAKRRAWSDGRGGAGCCDGEVCVCDLQRVIRAPQPTVSRHLAYLRRSGLVRQRKQGLWMYYRLAPAHGRVHAKLLECLDACGREMKELSDDVSCLCANKCCS